MGGYLLSIVGTIYAVILALVVVDATENYQQAMTIMVATIFETVSR